MGQIPLPYLRSGNFDFTGFPGYPYGPVARNPHLPMAAAQPAVLPLDRSLDALRREIDALDDTMFDLLGRRAALAVEVAQAKARTGGNAAPLFRPGREAEILRRLIGRTRAPLAPALVARVWREIIVASTCVQGRFTVAVPAGASCIEVAREHFGSRVLQPVASGAAVLAAVAKGRVQLGILPLPGGAARASAWWSELPRSLNVLGRLPFVTTGARRLKTEAGALIVGRQDFEPSGDDVFYLQAEGAALKGLPSSSVRATARRRRTVLRLIETAMPFEEIAKLAAGRGVRFLGGYARPIILSAS